MTRWDDFPVTLGTVISIDPDSAMAMVDVEGAAAPAWMPDHLWLGTESGPAVAAGSTVTLLRMIGGYQMVSAFTGTAGGGVPTLGPELLANGTFESGAEGGMPDGWTSLWDFGTGEAQPWAITLESPLQGAQAVACRVLPDYTHNSTFYRSVASRIDPGRTYNLTGFVSGVIAAGTVTASLEVITGATDADAAYFGAGTLQVVASITDPGEAWPPFGGDFTVPADHTYIRVSTRVTSGGSPGADATVRFDALSLKQRLA